MKRIHGAIATLLLAVAMGAWAVRAPQPAGAAAAGSPPPSRWVAVSVATLWTKPRLARPVDARAVANPADPRGWIAGMTTAQKRWLVGRLETQALYGERVYVLATSGRWVKIAVPSQPTPRSKWGYPGWVPAAQLTRSSPSTTPWVAVIRRPTAWTWRASDFTGRGVELSYGTRLPVVGWTDSSIEVMLLGGRHVYLRRSAAALRKRGAAWPRLTGAALATEARRFLGLQYLWGGTSGFGYDCSGLTYAVHRRLGKTVARDAGPQFARGPVAVSRAALRPGDLVFFRGSSGGIHHVGMNVGGGRMIHVPRTGLAVGTAPIPAQSYAGARRYWR